MKEAILDALKDTLITFFVIFILYVLISFVETKLTNKFKKATKYSPIIGAGIGLIPQCGFSIVASDLYLKNYISMGTLIAIFISCSDEALPILLSSPNSMIMCIPLLLTKFVVATVFGYFIDFIFRKPKITISTNNEEIENNDSCCFHHHNNSQSKIKEHLVHPLIHSLKISLYVLIVNIVFALLIYYVKEDNIKSFINNNIYLTPLLSSIVGLIPTCASSIIITELFVSKALSFGATISGLICNAGLGLIYLFKKKENFKNNLLIVSLLFAISLIVGYIILFIEIHI